jgi:hypothetical protein
MEFKTLINLHQKLITVRLIDLSEITGYITSHNFKAGTKLHLDINASNLMIDEIHIYENKVKTDTIQEIIIH